MRVIQGGRDKGRRPGCGSEDAGLGAESGGEVGPKDVVTGPAGAPGGLSKYYLHGGSVEYLLYFFFPKLCKKGTGFML